MKTKYTKSIAKLLVNIGYADYSICTRNSSGKIIGYAVCWNDNDNVDDEDWYDDEKHYISLFSKNQPTREGIMQAHALENYFAWDKKELWDESERASMRPLSEGKYGLYERRLDRIKYCIKEITNG